MVERTSCVFSHGTEEGPFHGSNGDDQVSLGLPEAFLDQPAKLRQSLHLLHRLTERGKIREKLGEIAACA
jgi:hypothetical protein